MNKGNSKSNFILLIAFLAVIILLLVMNIYRIRQYGEASLQIASLTKSAEEKQARLSMLEDLEEIRPELTQALKTLNEKIPQQPSEYELVNEIQSLASENGLDLIQLEFTERKDKKGTVELPFTMTVAGKYSSLVGLLERFSEGKRLVRIDELLISREENQLSKVRADISAAAFSSGVSE